MSSAGVELIPFNEDAGAMLSQKMRSASEILICSRLLGDARIITALSYASKMGSFVAAILDDKINVRRYSVPSYLSQSGVGVLRPKSAICCEYAIIDGKEAYVFPSFESIGGGNGYIVVLSSPETVAMFKSDFRGLAKNSEISDETRLNNPEAQKNLAERLK